MNPLNLLYPPVATILVALYQMLVFIHVPYALGFAIILLTIIIRFILYPLTASQLRTSQKMQKITPHLNKLKEKHKNDPKTLQAETMRLYKEHGVNPAAGCLPVLIQLPLIWGLYGVLQKFVGAKPQEIVHTANSLIYPSFPFLKLHTAWDTHFFGISLGQSPAHLLSSAGIVVLLLPLLTAAFQFVQSKMMFQSFEEKIGEVEKEAAKTKNKALVKEVKKEDDFASAMQTQSMYFLPVMIGFFSWSLPVGLSLYWNTFTIFGIIQQYRISGWGGLTPWIKKLRK